MSTFTRIYLDNNATTGMDPRVLEAMLGTLSNIPHNPSSVHWFGQQAAAQLQRARETIAAHLHVKPQEVLFTSGGTESMNLLIHGILGTTHEGHVISTNVEHACVYQTLKTRAELGLKVTFLPAGLYGAVTTEHIQNAICKETRLIVLSAANSETGVKHDLTAIAKIAASAQIPFLVDAVSLFGKEPISLPPGVTGMGFSGHKFHAPQGIGFAFIKSSYPWTPWLLGGEQEFLLRAGTPNLPGIVGLAKAVELLDLELPKAMHQMALLRDKLEGDLLQKVNPVIVNGMGPRVANTTNLAFPGVSGEDLLISLDMAGIAVSHGSACSSRALEPSRILRAMGLSHPIARSAIRFSLSRNTTLEEIEHTIQVTSDIVSRLRRL